MSRQELAQSVLDDLLSGAGAPESVGRLVEAEWSWRLVVLSVLRDALAARPDAVGPLPEAAAAWSLLERAHVAAPGPVRELLSYPTLGTWATHLLRRLRGTTASERPLWVETGRLHELAATASIVAGLDFELAVPVLDGGVLLPSLGSVRLAEGAAETVADVVAAAGRVRVRTRPPVGSNVEGGAGAGAVELPADLGVESEGWRPQRRAHGRAAGLTLSVALEDSDPYRGFLRPEPPAPLDDAAVARWQRLTQDAFALLASDDPDAAAALARGLTALVPVPAAEPFRPQSASSGDAFGAALASTPDDAVQLACTFAHEFAHNRLGALFHLFDFYCDEESRLGYAPWRDDPRPLGGRLQGVYAFTAVTGFWLLRRREGGGLAELEFALWRAQTRHALRTMAEEPGLTAMGTELVSRLAARLRSWESEPVAPEALAAAETLAADHRAAWRAHHLRVPADVGALLAEARSQGERPDPELLRAVPTVSPDPSARDLDARAVLTRLRLTAPERLTGAAGHGVSGATPQDVLLVTGRPDAAQAGYLARIAADPDDVSAWIGLGLALRALGSAEAASGLLARPELVLALSREETTSTGRAPDPVSLATWLGGVLASPSARDALRAPELVGRP